MVLLKETILQKKALILSFKMTPWKWVWLYHVAATPSCTKITFFAPCPPMLFTARRRGALLVMSRPQIFRLQKAQYQRKFFEIRLFPQFLKMKKIRNIFSLAFFNILKEPLVVQKQMIPQKKALIFSCLQLEKLRARYYQEGTIPPCPQSIFCWFFMWAPRVFDFLPSMTSLGDYFKDTITFRVSF